MKLPRALKRLNKKMLNPGFCGGANRSLVLKAVKAAKSASELISVAMCTKFYGEEENDLVLKKARSFKMNYGDWLILFEKAEEGSELKDYADDMSCELSPFFEKDDDDEFD